MKSFGEVFEEHMTVARQVAKEREEKFRERAADKKNALDLVSEDFGLNVAALLPDEFSFSDYAMLDVTGADAARRRLALCAKCPSHGGACVSEYEAQRGRKPKWDRENGLTFDWCNRWPEYIVREKLASIGVGNLLIGCRFGTYVPISEKQKEALEDCTTYAKKFKREETRANLVIRGLSYGVGKTHLAVSVLANLIATHRVRNAMFCYLPDFLEAIRRSYDKDSDDGDQALVVKACKTDLLVLDDLAAQRTTDWVREQLNMISNARWSNGLPTIITSNVSQEELEETLGPRTTSRWFNNGFAVDVDGPDGRHVKDEGETTSGG